MRKELVLTAIASAVIGAGLMLLATGGRDPAGIEGWMPVNAEVKSALAEEGAGSKDSGAAAAAGNTGEVSESQTAKVGGSSTSSTSTAGANAAQGSEAGGGSAAVTPTDGGGKTAETGKISINLAGLAELQEIPGIGEKKAQAILDYRNAHGAFASIEDLTQVKGIGDKMLEKMKPYISL
ncbi:ComE operon protein 1 [compost metagenome]